MDTFRISLIVLGISVLIGIYLYDSNKKIREYFKNLNLKQYLPQNNHSDDDYAREPEINDDSDVMEHIERLDDVVTTNPYSEEKLQAQEDEIIELTDEITKSLGEEMVVVFFVIAKNEHYFTGTDINEVCISNSFEYSDKNTYEKFSDINVKDKRVVASIVNSFEPGTFDSDFNNFDTKAITIILFLPGPDAEMTAFDDIVMRAKNIAHELNGELCDETRSVLTPQTVSHLKEKIEAFQFKNKMLKTSQQR